MNDNDFYLSLGNIIRVIKELSKNKTSALQTEIFCTLFKIEEIKDTTVNNYCVGIRSIKGEYKQIYIYHKSHYLKEKDTLLEVLFGILNILEGKIHTEKTKEILNQNETIEELTRKLYNIAKNDENIEKEQIKQWKEIINRKEYDAFLCETLFYAILENKQPLYELEKKKNKIEVFLNDSFLSYKGIEDYLYLKCRETINYDYNLKKLASEGNILANYELGSNEYMGYTKGIPRYIEAFEYLKVASNAKHAGATYLIGNMLYSGMLGSKTKKDLEEAYTYLEEARKLGSMAATNKLGLMYLQGIYPLKKDKEKAISLFLEAAEKEYVYALNNLGRIYEEEKNPVYIEYYKKSASLKESWACNKMGEYYRKKEDFKSAFSCYQDALEANERNLCYYAYYNLAKYFYCTGSKENHLEKNEKIYLEYLEIASEHYILEASVELFLFYVNSYLTTKKEELKKQIEKYKIKIECHSLFDKKVKKQVEEQFTKIKGNLKLNFFDF